MLTAKEVRKALDGGVVDSVGNGKEGVVVRRGFFYRHGMDAQKFEGVVLATLNAAGLQPTIVRSGEVWAPFRGGASVARSSHWYVIVK